MGVTRLQTIPAALATAFALTGAAAAQAQSISGKDVVGNWTLSITPAERSDLQISIQSEDGGRPDLPLRIQERAGGRLACTVSRRPADCRIRNGALVVVSGSGGARMIFTLTDRADDGFSGTARMRIRLLPIGGYIGSVRMIRR
jgi:hypothetical protein